MSEKLKYVIFAVFRWTLYIKSFVSQIIYHLSTLEIDSEGIGAYLEVSYSCIIMTMVSIPCNWSHLAFKSIPSE